MNTSGPYVVLKEALRPEDLHNRNDDSSLISLRLKGHEFEAPLKKQTAAEAFEKASGRRFR